jgi:hypothetical protein
VWNHTQTCFKCQQQKSSKLKPSPFVALLILDQPNVWINADLFGPMFGAERKNAYILCITDAFSKYAVVTLIPNQEAETVARSILNIGSVNLEFQHKFTLTEKKN